MISRREGEMDVGNSLSSLLRGVFMASVSSQQEPEGAGGGKGVQVQPTPLLPSMAAFKEGRGWKNLGGRQNLKHEQLKHLRPLPSGHRRTGKAPLEGCTNPPPTPPPLILLLTDCMRTLLWEGRRLHPKGRLSPGILLRGPVWG